MGWSGERGGKRWVEGKVESSIGGSSSTGERSALEAVGRGESTVNGYGCRKREEWECRTGSRRGERENGMDREWSG
jgi:hypothetical protein